MANTNKTLKKSFICRPSKPDEPARCVDGRPLIGFEGREGGAQMLGASLLPVVVHAISNRLKLDRDLIRTDFPALEKAGFGLGVHRGHHKDADAGRSDCGFGDNLLKILLHAQEKSEKYISFLKQAIADEPSLTKVFGNDAAAAVSGAEMAINSFDADKIALTGEDLISEAAAAGASMAEVTGDHAERAAFVNTDPETTFDANAANAKGFQGFSLDLVQSMDQAEALGVSRKTAGIISLMLYLATEEVLVEDKGKPALPVVIR